MTYPSKPGQRCKVIGGRTSANGEGKSFNEGKIVTTVFRHEEMAANCIPVWRCSGSNLVSYWGGVGDHVDFLEDWLEVLPEEVPPVKVKETEKELE